MREIDTIIFDLDGVLTDSLEDVADGVNVALSAMGVPEKSYVEIQGLFGHGAKSLFQKALGEDNAHLLDETIHVFKKYYNDNCVIKTRLYPGVEAVLKHFENKNMAVLTNKAEDSARIILKALRVDYYFGYIYGPASLSRLKPHPEGIEKLMNNFGSTRERTVMVGDSASDIEAGKAAGVITCAVKNGFGDSAELLATEPDYCLDSIHEMIDRFV